MSTLTPLDEFALLTEEQKHQRLNDAELRAHNAEYLLAEHLRRLDREIARAENIGVLPSPLNSSPLKSQPNVFLEIETTGKGRRPCASESKAMLRAAQRRARWSVLGSDPAQDPPKSHTTERVAMRQNDKLCEGSGK